MQHLVRNGVLKGVRGPRGGYTLARESRRITVGEVVRIVSELDADGEEAFSAGSELGRRTVQPIWDDCQAIMMAKIDKITLEDMCARAETAGIADELEGADNFTICVNDHSVQWPAPRSEERRVGQGWVSTCKTR